MYIYLSVHKNFSISFIQGRVSEYEWRLNGTYKCNPNPKLGNETHVRTNPKLDNETPYENKSKTGQ
jgi:hypothetical protein